MAWLIGATLRLSVENRLQGSLIDPDQLTLHVFRPRGARITFTYGEDSELVRDSTGKYHLFFTPDEKGRWRVRWISVTAGHTGLEEEMLDIIQTR